jgi:uncharacterized membrane protein
MNLFELLGLIGVIIGLILGIYFHSHYGILGMIIGVIGGFISGILAVFPIIFISSIFAFISKPLDLLWRRNQKRHKLQSITSEDETKN